MGNHPIDGMLGTTMEKIKEMVDVDSVIGKPITTPDSTTVIPISKVSYGFASGGSTFLQNLSLPKISLAAALVQVYHYSQSHFYLFVTVM